MENLQEPMDVDTLPELELVENLEPIDFEDRLKDSFEPFFLHIEALEATLDEAAQVQWNTLNRDRYQLWHMEQCAAIQKEVEAVATRFHQMVLGSQGDLFSAEARTVLLKAVSAYKDDRLAPGALNCDQTLMEAGFDFYRSTHDLLPFNRTGRLVRQVIENGGERAVA